MNAPRRGNPPPLAWCCSWHWANKCRGFTCSLTTVIILICRLCALSSLEIRQLAPHMRAAARNASRLWRSDRPRGSGRRPRAAATGATVLDGFPASVQSASTHGVLAPVLLLLQVFLELAHADVLVIQTGVQATQRTISVARTVRNGDASQRLRLADSPGAPTYLSSLLLSKSERLFFLSLSRFFDLLILVWRMIRCLYLDLSCVFGLDAT